jgi:hypothetical protein
MQAAIRNEHHPIWLAVTAVVALVFFASVGVQLAHSSTPAPAVPHSRTCFPADSWGPAPDAVRPCVELRGNSPEAGALRFVVSDASGVVRYEGFVNTTLSRIRSVGLQNGVQEDGSFCYVLHGARHGAWGCIGNLQD